MRTLFQVVVIAGLSFSWGGADAREWMSRDGQYRVEAELLTVDAGQAVLRRADGSVVRVPLERLSLADVKYVHEALQAAGLAPVVEPSAEEKKAALTAEPPRGVAEAEQSLAEADAGPPPAVPNTSRWQVVPDMAAPGFDLAPDASVEIRVGVQYSQPLVLFPSAPSPFVFLGKEKGSGLQQVWDLRSGQAEGEIDGKIAGSHRLALSPDGRHLAFHNYETRGEIPIWSFSAGKISQRLRLPERSTSIQFLDFAGPGRVVVGDSSTKAYLIYDIRSGEPSGKIEAEVGYDGKCCAVSPGGNYLAVYTPADQQLAIYDARNGVRAGRIQVEGSRSARPECLLFSPGGQELACWFGQSSEPTLHVWEMTGGKQTVSLQFAENPTRQFGFVRYEDRALEWLADGSGWLLSGVVLIDRESGKLVWQDEAASGQLEVLPRRIVDADRMLAFRTTGKQQTLGLVGLPKEQIAASRLLVASGGVAADAGLPPITEIDERETEQKTLGEIRGQYEPAPLRMLPEIAARNRFVLAPGAFQSGYAFFSRPDAAMVAFGESSRDGQAAWTSSRPLPKNCELFDLRSGKHAAHFEIPFATELIDVSPDGKLGLFRLDRNEDRLDVWDLVEGRHVVAFRPFAGAQSGDRKIAWARFLDESRVATASGSGRLAAWELAGCRAIYTYPPGSGRVAALTASRRTLVLVSQATPHLIDALTGDLLATLPEVKSDETIVVLQGSFSADEERLGLIFSCGKGTLLATWDLQSERILSQAELPFKAQEFVWCGRDHVLAHRWSLEMDNFDALIDVGRGCVVWNYRVLGRGSLWTSPDGRHWYLHRGSLQGPTELVAVELPDEGVKASLSQNAPPDPLVGPGSSVSVQTLIENGPQDIPEGWADLVNLEAGLQEHFSRQLQQKQVNVVVRNPVRVLVGIKQENQEGAVRIHSLFGPSGTVLVSATLVIPYVVVVDAGGNRIWEKSRAVQDADLRNLDERPPGVDLAAYANLKRWEAAARWLRAVEIPCPLFHPSMHRGLGESVVSPAGIEVLRSPGPSTPKRENKTT